jgi:hypothetical protein
MAYAMFAYTFGIVSDINGVEGKGLGTGVGVLWRGTYLILTAKHVVEDTPPHRICFFLPEGALLIPGSAASIDWTNVRSRRPYTLEKPEVVFAAGTDAAARL